MNDLKLVAARLGMTEDQVLKFSELFVNNIFPVLSYLEMRMARMRGDENCKMEIEQLRNDIGFLSQLALPEFRRIFV